GRNRLVIGIAASRGRPHNDEVAPKMVFVTYPRITALDLVGPHEVLGAAGGYDIVIAAPEPGVVRSTRGPGIVADRSFTTVRGAIDTLIVVGGDGAFDAAGDAHLVH